MEAPFHAIDGKLLHRTVPLAAGAHVAVRAQFPHICYVQGSPFFVKGIKVLQVFPLRDAVVAVLFLQPLPFVQAFPALGGIAGLAYPDNVIHDIFSPAVAGQDMLRGQILFFAAINAFPGMFHFPDPFANGGRPMYGPCAKLLPLAHNHAVIGLSEAGRRGNDFGILVINDLTDGFDGGRRHDKKIRNYVE